jgi:hypothetical protein
MGDMRCDSLDVAGAGAEAADRPVGASMDDSINVRTFIFVSLRPVTFLAISSVPQPFSLIVHGLDCCEVRGSLDRGISRR